MRKIGMAPVATRCGVISPRYPDGMTYICNLPAGHNPALHQRYLSHIPEVPFWDDDRSTDK